VIDGVAGVVLAGVVLAGAALAGVVLAGVVLAGVVLPMAVLAGPLFDDVPANGKTGNSKIVGRLLHQTTFALGSNLRIARVASIVTTMLTTPVINFP
jgi:hypothetical protein